MCARVCTCIREGNVLARQGRGTERFIKRTERDREEEWEDRMCDIKRTAGGSSASLNTLH